MKKTNLEMSFFLAGGKASVARQMGISRQLLHLWLVRGIPAAHREALAKVIRMRQQDLPAGVKKTARSK